MSVPRLPYVAALEEDLSFHLAHFKSKEGRTIEVLFYRQQPIR